MTKTLVKVEAHMHRVGALTQEQEASARYRNMERNFWTTGIQYRGARAARPDVLRDLDWVSSGKEPIVWTVLTVNDLTRVHDVGGPRASLTKRRDGNDDDDRD